MNKSRPFFGPMAALVIAIGTAGASTVAKWVIQARVGRVPLHGLPHTASYRFLIEDLPCWGCTVLLVCLVAWSFWRLHEWRDWVCVVTTVAAAWFAWWGMLFIVVGNSFDAFP